MYFEDTIDEAKYCGHLFGLGSSMFQNGIPYDTYMAPQTLAAVAQSVASQLHSHNSASQSSLANLNAGQNASLLNSHHNGNNSSSTPNLAASVTSSDSNHPFLINAFHIV